MSYLYKLFMNQWRVCARGKNSGRSEQVIDNDKYLYFLTPKALVVLSPGVCVGCIHKVGPTFKTEAKLLHVH